jgi:hypothetical protein
VNPDLSRPIDTPFLRNSMIVQDLHPELSTDRRLLVSYNVHSFDSNDLYEDVTIYRGRFIDVMLA